ncbi:hypothetical protein [Eubacterium barkeri]|uniref:Uncharacterized protein n=1 Tax=Eubacterium barkeri TaxID=1528 RepID=A0A1H3G795_EUBBA|nr:hypothetical protein [Eubacterium barkeri]SDX99192.1 hypothetical protein SAMN04488579_1133 [Eubacterium barkeri]
MKLIVTTVFKIKSKSGDTIQVYKDDSGHLYFNFEDFSKCCVITGDREVIKAFCDVVEVNVVEHRDLEKIALRKINVIRQKGI